MSKCKRDGECKKCKCSNCDCCTSCNDCDKCGCDHSKTVRLHKCDGQRLAEIPERLEEIDTTLKTIPAKLHAISGSIQGHFSNRSSHAENIVTHIDSLIETQRVQKQELEAQTVALNNISTNMGYVAHAINQQSIQVAMPDSMTANLQSMSSSLASIHKTQREMVGFLKNIWIPFLILAVLSILLPFLSRSVPAPTQSLQPPSPSPPPSPPPSPSPSPIAITIFNTNSSLPSSYIYCSPGNQCLNVRQSHSLSAPVLFPIPCNTPGVQVTGATVDSDGETWAYIRYQPAGREPISGWVVKRFLSQQGS